MALEGLGLDEEKLFKLSKKDYLERNFQLKKEKEDIQDKRYEHYEKRRLEAIEQARELYNEIIENENSNKNTSNEFDNNNNNDNKKDNGTQTNIKNEIQYN